jgi:hypothetical protein
MAIHVYWDSNDPSIIRWEYQDAWTWEQYHAAVDKSLTLSTDHTGRVDVISDMRRAGAMPVSVASLHIKYSLLRAPQNFGIMVLVAPDPFVHAMITKLQMIMPDVRKRIHMVETTGDAYAMIAAMRERTGVA